MSYHERFFRNAPSMNDRYQCAYCNKWFSRDEIEVDHRIPKAQGGTDDLCNLQAVCKQCNRSKGGNIDKEDIV